MIGMDGKKDLGGFVLSAQLDDDDDDDDDKNMLLTESVCLFYYGYLNTYIVT